MSEPAHPLTLPERGEPSWPAQGRWTYEDYLRLPEDGRRYEIIRGFLFVTPAPSYDHQYVVVQIANLFNVFVRQNSLGVVLTAPFDVRLPEDIGNPVQPDVVFIRRDHQPRPGSSRFDGVPDLVVEVLSPGNWRFDRTTKLEAYRDARVPEVWLVNPILRTVEVFGLSSRHPEYLLRESRGAGESVGSAVLADLRIEVAELFPPAD